jgi:hypothetical protein
MASPPRPELPLKFSLRGIPTNRSQLRPVGQLLVCRVTGHLVFGRFHLSDLRVNQELACIEV